MDGERGRCCDEVIMVKTLTAEARLWWTGVQCQIHLCCMLGISIINSGEMFSNGQMLTFSCGFTELFTPHFAKRSLQVSFLCHQQICLAETPLALFFPELGAGGGGSLSPTPPPKFGLNCPNVLITAPSSPVSGL